jgi:hypothetical protein
VSAREGFSVTHLYVAADGRVLFEGEVTGWTPPPALPTNPVAANYASLPQPIREALALAAAAAFEKATGFRVEIKW